MSGLLFWVFIALIIYYYYLKRKNSRFRKQRYSRNYTRNIKHGNNISNKTKGDLFEEFIVKQFDKSNFSILEWRSDKYIDGVYAQSNKNPDLEIIFQTNGFAKHFAVECKFRSEFNGKAIQIAREDQLRNYKLFEETKKIKVYIALGVGGIPQKPYELFIIPLSEIKYNILFYNTLSLYKKDSNTQFYYDTIEDKLK